MFTYLSENLLKLIYIIAGFVAVLLLIEHFVIPMEELFDKIVQNVSYEYVFVIFGVSETILGLIPPDLFIMWGKPLAGTLGVSPWLILFVLATLSYLGGIMAYFLGLGLQSRKGFKQWMELKHTDMFNKLRKWGGFLIGVAALLPIPFSLITLISGITRFPFKILLAVGLLRYLRFFLYAIVLWIMV